MAAPVAGYIILPDDSGNTGNKVRTQTRIVGGQTVDEHYFVPTSQYNRVGSFFLSMTQQSVQASLQNATSTGFLWFQNPAGATTDAIVRAASISYSSSAATAMPTSPVIVLARFTYSGTASGAAITPAKARTSETTNQVIARSAVTGMTVAVGGTVASSSVPCLTTAVGIYALKEWMIEEATDFETNDIRIVPGEGLVLYQTVNGTTSDVRRFTFDLRWDEVDNS